MVFVWKELLDSRRSVAGKKLGLALFCVDSMFFVGFLFILSI